MKNFIFSAGFYLSLVCLMNCVADNLNNAQNAKDALDREMHNIRENKPANIAEVADKYGEALLPELRKYQTSDIPEERRESYSGQYWIAKTMAPGNAVRKDIVENLINGLDDTSSVVRQYSRDWLYFFTEADFSDDAKQHISSILHNKESSGIILLIGVANMQDEIPFLNKMISEELDQRRKDAPWYVSSKYWAAVRACARMGNKDDVTMCIETAESETNFYYKISWLERLNYIRQPEIVNHLKKYLYLDDYIGGDGDVVKTPVAFYIARGLSEMIDGFPKQNVPKQTKYETADAYVERCRKWFDENRSLKLIR